MKHKLSETIKLHRKTRGMTQEQLAELLDVTVGAVHKWERGLSTPDLGYVLDMADIFAVSTDVLLGYEWRSGNVTETLERIRTLRAQEQHEAAIEEAERALKKFPNHFELVYEAGLCYRDFCGTYPPDRSQAAKAYDRGIVLLQHALELLPQDTDVTAFAIYREIAALHQYSHHIERAIAVLERSNINGVNDAQIGNLYANFLHDDAKARSYLSRAYAALMDDMESVLVGITNLFFHQERYDEAIATYEWLRRALRGIQPETVLTSYDRYDAYGMRTLSILHYSRGDHAAAKAALREAYIRAKRFDAAKAAGTLVPMRIYEVLSDAWQPKYDLYHTGMTAFELIDSEIPLDEEMPQIRSLWEEVQREVDAL